ncbi:far upstream element-binding protein 3 [Phtheirospermum japonicum]|uniref:Far upstream element-binding protein 3 n=1 Tax=Phtheirospermum japonicum TaxID=374723 RepID=A0A830CG26_9LAMI|nr:far upstream element-binding protein 3 [Phtheirospermum japonicum]
MLLFYGISSSNSLTLGLYRPSSKISPASAHVILQYLPIKFAQMAEEVLYSSVGGESNKRKYEDSPPPPVPRRASGFSSPPVSAAPPSSYNSVPPPLSEIEFAKQKAQEIAARLLSNADPLKRARVENGGGGGGGGYDSSDYSTPKPMGLGFSGQPHVASSGYPGTSKKIEIPSGRVGVIIGKGGDTIKYLQHQSGAKIQVTRDMDADPNSTTRAVELMGTSDQIAKAEQLINETLSEAEAGGTGGGSRRLTGQTYGSEQFVMKVANNKVGLVIGKGGETIKSMQAKTGARIQVIPLHLPPGDMSKERTVQIDGTSEQIEAARQLVEEVTSERLADIYCHCFQKESEWRSPAFAALISVGGASSLVFGLDTIIL